MDWQAILDSLVAWATTAGVRLLVAFAVLFISFRIVNRVARRIERSGNRQNADKTIMRTMAYAFKVGMKLVILVCLVGYVGIDTSGLTALITSLGVCVGLAVNGALSNLAGGVLIILTRPFRIDDYIETEGYSGTVEDIHLTNTKLRTPDNKVIFIPNGTLSSSTVINYSMKDTRRVDQVFSVAYSSDYQRAKAILLELYQAHPLVLSDPAPFVRVSEHAASSIDITARVWVKSGDYHTVRHDLLESVLERFDAEGIEVPFEQLDVRVRHD